MFLWTNYQFLILPLNVLSRFRSTITGKLKITTAFIFWADPVYSRLRLPISRYLDVEIDWLVLEHITILFLNSVSTAYGRQLAILHIAATAIPTRRSTIADCTARHV